MSKIKQEANNTFSVDFIKMVNGKRIHIYKRGFDTFKAAESAIPMLLEKRLNESNAKMPSTRFSDFSNSYIEHRSRKVRESTILTIKSIFKVLLEEYSEKPTANVLSVHNIIHLHKEIIEKDNVGEKWKNRVIGELRLIVDYAHLLKIIDSENASDDKAILENISITKINKEKQCYTSYQLKKFLNHIDDENDKDMLTLYAYLGLRISEFVGLTWDCYDKANKTIEIKQQILYLQQGKPILTDKLKTKESYRKCKLNEEIINILEKRKNLYGDEGYLFSKNIDQKNIPISKGTIRKKMQKYMKKAKLPIITPHGFRHTKATQFMSVCKNMEELKAAARFMGHSVTMMIETYGHAEERTIDTLIKRLDNM